MSDQVKRPLREILIVAREVVEKLSPYCERIEIAGSIRREVVEVGDIELVTIPIYQSNLLGPSYNLPSQLDLFFEDHNVPLILGGKNYKKGKREKLKSFMYRGVKIDLFLPTRDNWGIIYLIRTGSRDFSKWFMSEIKPKHKVDKGRLWVWSCGKWEEISTPTEESVFTAVGIPYIPPRLRDNNKWLE